MAMDRRISPSGKVLVELWFSGFVTTVPARRREMSPEDRVWLDEIARPELHARWVRLLQHEVGPRMRARRARRLAERARVIDRLDRRRRARELDVLGRRRARPRYQQLTFSWPKRGSTAST